MITKSRIIALLAILGVGFLVLRSGDEPTDSDDQGSGSESATDRKLQPREPAFQTPDSNYGIARRPGTSGARPPYGRPDFSPGESYFGFYSGGYRTPNPYNESAPVAGDRYRFRPLDEQEKRRTGTTYPDQYPDQYATPFYPSPSYYPSPMKEPQPNTPAPYAAPPAYLEPHQEVYSFRPLEKSPGARGRWQGPYQEPGRRFDHYPADPWTSPPPPQWGSMPPSQRMYPNLNRDPGRRLTAR